MLVSQHAALSILAATVAAPLVKDKKNLGLFLGAAVGQDVDHYLWYVVKFHNPSLRDAYRWFRKRYGKPWHKVGDRGQPRALHGFGPLALVVLGSLIDRRLVPVAAGMAFHGFLDALNEYVFMPIAFPGFQPSTSKEPRQLAAPQRDRVKAA